MDKPLQNIQKETITQIFVAFLRVHKNRIVRLDKTKFDSQTLLAYSENAVKTHLWVAVCIHLLVSYIKQMLKKSAFDLRNYANSWHFTVRQNTHPRKFRYSNQSKSRSQRTCFILVEFINNLVHQ
jgi:hypothetical protein